MYEIISINWYDKKLLGKLGYAGQVRIGSK